MRIAAAALLAAAALAAAPGCGEAAGRDRPPNVILIVMDTTRADRCSVFGYEQPTTPSLERLAARGIAFEDAWSPGGWTAPAHASLFTGLSPLTHGFDLGRHGYLREEFTTLAERLREGGWRTACFTNNDMVTEAFGLVQGFDEVVPICAEPDVPYPWARETHERAAKWVLEAHADDEPFFLFVNDMEPHLPYTPPADLLPRFVPGDVTLRETTAARGLNYPQTLGIMLGREPFTDRQRTVVSGHYDAEIAALDAEIGALLHRLEAAGALENTLVVVCGDHGENLGEHGLVTHRFSLHRTLLHVPLIVRLPGDRRAGERVADVVRLEDVLPTVLETCGLPVTAEVEGVSLLAPTAGRIARGTQGRPEGYMSEVLEHYPGASVATFDTSIESVYDGRHHLIEWSDGRTELYDVEADPLETRNLRVVRPDLVARLRALLRSHAE